MDFQGHLADGGKKIGTFMGHIYLEHMKKIDPEDYFSDIVMFDGYSNIQLEGKQMKVNYPKF